MLIPEISSGWRILLKPEKFGDYVNDHTVFRDKNGWRLIGITAKGAVGATHERYFINATGSNLLEPFREVCKSIDTGTLCWSPCVIEHNNIFFMFYGPSPTKMAVSLDCVEWFGYEINLNAPFFACHRDHFVMKTDESEWLMYVSGITPDGGGSIACLASSDLKNWDFCSYALTSAENAPLKPAWGALESPYVVKRGNLYYLFVTYTDCSASTYNNTLVFVSENPKDFGTCCGTAKKVTSLNAHAPEIIECDGEWFITTCGWRGNPMPHDGCVSIARLKWVDAE